MTATGQDWQLPSVSVLGIHQREDENGLLAVCFFKVSAHHLKDDGKLKQLLFLPGETLAEQFTRS